MFAKVFTQILDSSLANDYLVRLVFEDLLKLCDMNGVVDLTIEAVARRTNVPLDIVKRGIEALERPDPQSRTPDHEGRRLVRLDEHRAWGWVIINYAYYRGLASEEQRREKTRARVENFRKRNGSDNGNADVTHGNAGNAMQREKQTQTQRENTPTPFEVFWKAYPRKTGKGAAELKFNKTKGVELETLLAALETQKKSFDWQKDGGQFIPHPATWLNQRRWEDEVFVTAQQPAAPRAFADPPSKQLAAVEEQISKHKANRGSAYFNANHTQADKDAYEALKKRRTELRQQITGTTP